MKIIAYAIRNDEVPYVKQWSKENDVEVKIVQELLTMDNIDLCKGYDGLVSYQQKPYSAELIDRMRYDGIKYWSLRNVGIDNIDLEAVKRNHIVLTNVPAYSPDSVGEFSVLSALRLLRQSKAYEHKMRNGNFMWAPNIGKELHELTVGVIGTGHIGMAAVKYFKGFGCKVIAYNRHHNHDVDYVDTLDELFAQADIIDLHTPLTPETKYMINDKAISKMKDGVYIINTARGEVVDTNALIRGLDSGKIAGVALDTYESEVGIFNNTFDDFDAIPDARLKDLMSRDNVLITPHIGFYTETAVHNMVYSGLTNNKELIESNGQKADSIVPLP